METVQQDDERALPLVDIVHADAVDLGKAMIERAGIVGIHLPQCCARLIEVPRSARSIFIPSFEIAGRQDITDRLRALSFP
jgi:hypothetical protein